MDIIFWLDTVPVCCKGVFDAVARKWPGQTYYVCAGQLDENRKRIIEDEPGLHEAANYIYLGNMQDKQLFFDNFLEKHQDDIHIFAGYRGKTIDKVIEECPMAKVFVWAERPSPPKIKGRYPWALFHVYYAMKYRDKVKALLPLGKLGVKSYARYGWPKEKLFPFLYLPVLNEALPVKKQKSGDKIRFVYVGRFTKGSKGTDVLMRSLRYLKCKNYTLDMVGGYGDYLEKTMEWIEKEDSVHFGGTWPIGKVCERLNEYDVCIIPSRYEGWNVTLNEALMAGIGCIATDECVSDEMISACGAGCVVKANSAKALAKAMDDVMEHPEKIAEWNEKAYAYRMHMTADVCAQYFIEVIQYQIDNSKKTERPEAPWLVL